MNIYSTKREVEKPKTRIGRREVIRYKIKETRASLDALKLALKIISGNDYTTAGETIRKAHELLDAIELELAPRKKAKPKP